MKALAVIGPTAGGKTALSLSLAHRLGGEIICCDSMQIYRGMDIGTAKPTAEEQRAVPHHLLDIADPGEPFSAADYAAAAMRAVREITARGAVPIFCGGTGLYLDAVRTLRHAGATPPPNPALREELLSAATDEAGRHALWERLRTLDPAAAAATHPNNVRRVVRALEICLTSGHTKTELDAAASLRNPELDICVTELLYENRALLYSRIDARVDAMLKAGLLDETRRLREAGCLCPGSTAAQAIGYKELLPCLDGAVSPETAAAALCTATRRYAKRQMTYFRKMKDVHPLVADRGGGMRPLSDLTDEAERIWHAFLTASRIQSN